jgi:hypothetical protein
MSLIKLLVNRINLIILSKKICRECGGPNNLVALDPGNGAPVAEFDARVSWHPSRP